LFIADGQFDAAEDAVSRVLHLTHGKGQEFRVCDSHRILGYIHRSKGEKEKAIHYFETALGIASRFDWRDQLFWIHYELAGVFHREGEFDNANVHIEQAKSYVVNDAYRLGFAMELQATVWCQQDRLEEANSEALRALEIYEKLGAIRDVAECKGLVEEIEEEMKIRPTSS
jgi:tetratricopeptide (TPR) repeat protein